MDSTGLGKVITCKEWATSVSNYLSKAECASSYITPKDAVRHCLDSCCFAAKMGQADALSLLQSREPNTPVSPLMDNAMDKHNNGIGGAMGEVLHSIKGFTDG